LARFLALTSSIQTTLKRISELSGDITDDTLNNHPIFKDKLDGNIDQLKDMGDQFGPEAKKIVDETWKQVQDIPKGGVGVGTADQLRRLIQDKTREVRNLADQAWQKGWNTRSRTWTTAPRSGSW
jgi:ElaB/YqjD/DUF883 family membrane-anchored ribosome-binding protein